MKAILRTSSVLLVISLFFINVTQAQEYDDLYFRKSDRVKLKKLQIQEQSTHEDDTYLYDEIEKLEGKEEAEDMLSEYKQNEQPDEEIYYDEDLESTIIEKHYYYRDYATRYDRGFDDIFWSDPYLYQGAIFDPSLYYYGYRSSYWRPGWNVSVSFGNRWNRNRWGGNYWGRRGYHYGYYDAWSYHPWNYNSYWCPPYYGNRGNITVYNGRSGQSRGITRGRRSSRNSSANYNGRHSGRSGRTTNDDNPGGKGGRSGRYVDHSRNYRNSSRAYDGNTTNSRRRSSTNAGSRNSSRTYNSGSRNSNNSKTNTYRSRSRSSNNSGSRSSGSSARSSSSGRSKSSSSSRSSRSKRDN